MRKVIFGVLITIVVVGTVLLLDRSLRLNRPFPSQDGQGKTLPISLKLNRFPGKEAASFRDFEGKVVLVNFWASWCEACMAEMPSIQKLHDALQGEGLVIVSVNVDENPDRVVPQIVGKLRLNFPIYTDTDGELSKAFDVMAIPFSAVADRKMKVVWTESGERNWASAPVIAEIRKLLKPL